MSGEHELYERWRHADMAAHRAENVLFAMRMMSVQSRAVHPVYLQTATSMRRYAETVRQMYVERYEHEPEPWLKEPS